MRTALAALGLALLASCVATTGAVQDLNQRHTELQHAVAELERATLSGVATDAQLAVLESEVKTKTAALEAQVKDVREAAAADARAIREDPAGVILGPAEQGGLYGLGITALAWFLRDRRKRLGTDPVQLKDKGVGA